MITDIRGKKILLLTPAFFHYEHMIADKMRKMGALVDMYDVRSVTSAWDRAILKISPAIFSGKSKRYYEEIIERNKDKNYDYILVIKCDMTPVSILRKFRTVFPNAKLCLNLWDSVENNPGIRKKFRFFDTLHSFDYLDCEKYPELKFRPLFFGDQFRKTAHRGPYQYDICFCGTIHSDRYAVIRQIQRIADERGWKCFWFMYLQSKYVYLLYKILKKEFKRTDPSVFRFDAMPVEEITRVIDDSRVVLDVQHPRQTGLTMRTIEMIGMQKKIITTNPNVRDYDFFCENNVAVVDRNDVRIPEGFLETPYQALPKEIYEKYSLESWILEVLS